MLSFSFIPNEPYYNETQALYIALFDNPQSSNSGGLTYWENYLAVNQAGALNAISGYTGLNGALSAGAVPLSPSNIGTEINTIYENLFGTAVSSSAATTWANQWIGEGDGGTLSIGQITAAIYNVVENLPSTNSYYETMNNHILNYFNEAQALYIGLFDAPQSSNSGGLTYWENYLAVNQTGALNAMSDYAGLNGALSAGAALLSSSNIGTEINAIYENLLGTAATSKSEAYWSGQWIGDGGTGTMSIGQITAAIYNVVENLPSTNSYYETMNNHILMADTAASFNYTLGIISSGAGNPNDIIINNSGGSNSFTFADATDADTFIVQANTYSLTLGNAANNNTVNIIMEGSILETLSTNSANINIDLAGSTFANLIENINYTGNAGANFPIILDVFSSAKDNSGADSLSLGVQGNADSGIGLNDGSALYINGSSNITFAAYFYDNAAVAASGVTVNASGFAGALTLHDSNLTVSPANSADTIILGSGSDNIITNAGNDTVTVGSGADTITASAVTVNGNTFTTIEGSVNMPVNSNDSIVFAQAGPGQINLTALPDSVTAGAATAAAAISGAIAYLQGIDGYSTLDTAAWFYFGGNTYVVNDYQNTEQAVKLVGTADISAAVGSSHTISNL